MQINGTEEIEVCEAYEYLGTIFDGTGTDANEIRVRTIKERTPVGNLNQVL